MSDWTHLATGRCARCRSELILRPLNLYDPSTGSTLCCVCGHVYVQTMPRAITALEKRPAFTTTTAVVPTPEEIP